MVEDNQSCRTSRLRLRRHLKEGRRLPLHDNNFPLHRRRIGQFRHYLPIAIGRSGRQSTSEGVRGHNFEGFKGRSNLSKGSDGELKFK